MSKYQVLSPATKALPIVKTYFTTAMFDAIELDYFADDYEENEALIQQAVEQKVIAMPLLQIANFAAAAVTGHEIKYSVDTDTFYIEERDTTTDSFTEIDYFF
jgi:hypothetical protein